MGSPSSHVLRVFPPVKRSCRSGGQKGKAHANGQCWPRWVSGQRWPPACITPGAQHAGHRMQYITSTGGISQAHLRIFFLHQPMHQVQQPIGELRTILGEDRWFRASFVESMHFLRKFVPPSVTIGDPLTHSHQSYGRYGLATRAVLPPTSSTSPQLTNSLPQLEQQKDGVSTPTKRPPPPSVQPTDHEFHANRDTR